MSVEYDLYIDGASRGNPGAASVGVVIIKDGKKVKMQEGKIIILLDGILETDHEHRWEGKPLFYVLRTIFDKYVYTPFVSGFERGVKDDTMTLKNNLKAFLNLSRYA